MSEESNEEVTRLKADLDALKGENAKLARNLETLKGENKKLATDAETSDTYIKELRREIKGVRLEKEAATQQLAEVGADRDAWKTKAETDPEGLKAQLAEVGGKLRQSRHERAYEKVARNLRVTDPTKYEDLLKIAGHSPEGDDPDEDEITSAFQSVLKGRPWLVDAVAEAAKPAPEGASVATAAVAEKPVIAAINGSPGPGADRGQSLSQPASQPAHRAPGRL